MYVCVCTCVCVSSDSELSAHVHLLADKGQNLVLKMSS